ncbi:helix-turn-helix transcriptional regulator [uncultured Selenomonas sp.]|uniref:helix-turn-helix domain-containing protein n=1 Tax=uncultured Selenomonas sp. TaxID=159275 RepID=UPI0025E7CFBC|nr:helix-turn-helix transcriptional regulator [uncultured Selenomonas sp.]
MTPDERQSLLQDLRRYLKAHYVPEKSSSFPFSFPIIIAAASAVPTFDSYRNGRLSDDAKAALLASIQKMLQPGFREMLFELIRKKGIRNADLYHRSDITKAHFSKIKNDEHYHPSKETVLALALGLKLTLDETKKLLERAGYTLTASSQTDLVVKYFIDCHLYDIDEVNDSLDALGLSTLTNYKRPRKT